MKKKIIISVAIAVIILVEVALTHKECYPSLIWEKIILSFFSIKSRVRIRAEREISPYSVIYF